MADAQSLDKDLRLRLLDAGRQPGAGDFWSFWYPSTAGFMVPRLRSGNLAPCVSGRVNNLAGAAPTTLILTPWSA